MRKPAATLLLLILILAASFGVVLGMARGAHTASCPYGMGTSALCNWSVLSHVSMWRLIFSVVESAPFIILGAFLILIILGSTSLIPRAALAEGPPRTIWRKVENPHSTEDNYLIRLMARGILHAKLAPATAW
ncbi:MAG: hypothetical protein HY978_00355 [Candidatus Liptonbacteria bacterium]|nr:hypothetical protein [Candidatus Liptonbacteria bacterium]